MAEVVGLFEQVFVLRCCGSDVLDLFFIVWVGASIGHLQEVVSFPIHVQHVDDVVDGGGVGTVQGGLFQLLIDAADTVLKLQAAINVCGVVIQIEEVWDQRGKLVVQLGDVMMLGLLICGEVGDVELLELLEQELGEGKDSDLVAATQVQMLLFEDVLLCLEVGGGMVDAVLPFCDDIL